MATVEFGNVSPDMRFPMDGYHIAEMQAADAFMDTFTPVREEILQQTPTLIVAREYDASGRYIEMTVAGTFSTGHITSISVQGGGVIESLVGNMWIDASQNFYGTVNEVRAYRVSDGALLVRYSGVNVTINDAMSSLRDADVLSGNDAVISGAGNDYLLGYAGNDMIDSGPGNDTIDGGTGADQMSGGAGDDLYLVDNGADSIIETSGAGVDEARSTATYALPAHVENLVLLGAGAINGTGNELANAITGNAAANTLSGDAGDDVLIGGGGADALDGGAGYDTAVIAFARSQATTLTSSTVTHPTHGTTTLTGIEARAFLEVDHGGSFVPGQSYYRDVNGDGRIDLTLQNDSLQFWLSSGTASGFASPTLAFQHGGPSGYIRNQTQFADIDGDHLQDAIFQGIDNRFWLLKSNGSAFDAPVLAAVHGGDFNPACVQYGDVSGDGRADLIYQGLDNRFWISLSTGSSFGDPYWANTHGGEFNPGKVQYADVSGDGRVDLVYQGDDNRFWLSVSDGTRFGDPVLAAVVTHDDFDARQARYVDMNGDGRADLMYQGDGNEFWYYASTGSAFAAGTKALDLPGVFQEGSAGYGDVTGDGNGDIVYQNASNDFHLAVAGADWMMG